MYPCDYEDRVPPDQITVFRTISRPSNEPWTLVSHLSQLQPSKVSVGSVVEEVLPKKPEEGELVCSSPF